LEADEDKMFQMNSNKQFLSLFFLLSLINLSFSRYALEIVIMWLSREDCFPDICVVTLMCIYSMVCSISYFIESLRIFVVSFFVTDITPDCVDLYISGEFSCRGCREHF
jgi:hypothetical protein